jgi:hypothetical protein
MRPWRPVAFAASRIPLNPSSICSFVVFVVVIICPFFRDNLTEGVGQMLSNPKIIEKKFLTQIEGKLRKVALILGWLWRSFGLLDHMSTSSQISTVEEQRREMIRVARRILDGTVGIVAGARQLTRLRFPSRTENDSDILVFIGIDSESDHLPIGDVRQHWNPDALLVKDAELTDYEARVRERAFEACRNLIEKYDHDA